MRQKCGPRSHWRILADYGLLPSESSWMKRLGSGCWRGKWFRSALVPSTVWSTSSPPLLSFTHLQIKASISPLTLPHFLLKGLTFSDNNLTLLSCQLQEMLAIPRMHVNYQNWKYLELQLAGWVLQPSAVKSCSLAPTLENKSDKTNLLEHSAL